jgi:hypothetical protein
MSNSVYGIPLRALEGTTKTLATSAGYVAVKPGYHEVKMYCAAQWRLALSPALLHAVVYTAATGAYVDYVQKVTDGDSTTNLPLDALLTADMLYLGFSEPALGVYFDIGTGVQAEAATLDVEYCSVAMTSAASPTFADVADDSDGTTSGGATLAVDGAYVWTLPAAWKNSKIGTFADPKPFADCYWIRMKPSATLTAETDILSIIPIYQNANYGYMEPGMEYQFSFAPSKTGGFVVAATSATPTLNITWIKH